MSNVTANLYPCAHCSESGTCRTGVDGASCARCVNAHELKGGIHFGIACGRCGGLGKAEPTTEQLHKRTPSILGSGVVLFLLGLIGISALLDKHFTEIITFSSTVFGTVMGYYFRSHSKDDS